MTTDPAAPHVTMSYAEFSKVAAAVRGGLGAAGAAIAATGQDAGLTELVKLRASQINGCAFCLAFHLDLARKAGVPQVQLDLLAGWRDAGVFSPRVAVALAWTEELTRLAGTVPSAETRAALARQFTADEIVFLTATVGLINAWNRIAVGLGFQPPRPA